MSICTLQITYLLYLKCIILSTYTGLLVNLNNGVLHLIYIYESICLSIYTYIYLSIFLPIRVSKYLFYLSVYLSIYVYVYIYLSIYSSVYLYIYLNFYLYIFISFYISICLSTYLSLYFFYPSIFQIEYYQNIYIIDISYQILFKIYVKIPFLSKINKCFE